jgi:hypothetical protein
MLQVHNETRDVVRATTTESLFDQPFCSRLKARCVRAQGQTTQPTPRAQANTPLVLPQNTRTAPLPDCSVHPCSAQRKTTTSTTIFPAKHTAAHQSPSEANTRNKSAGVMRHCRISGSAVTPWFFSIRSPIALEMGRQDITNISNNTAHQTV